MNRPFPKLAAPAMRALQNAEISSLEDLGKHTEKEIMNLHGMGKNAMEKLKAAMLDAGVSFLP